MTFEQWLQKFNSGLHIETITNEVIDKSGKVLGRRENPSVEVLYWKKKRLCSVPKGSKNARWFTDTISDIRTDKGYTTEDGTPHRSLSGIGTYLLINKIINPQQFVDNFLTSRNKEYLQKIINQGWFKHKDIIIPRTLK